MNDQRADWLATMFKREPPELALLWIVLGLLTAYLLLTWAPVIVIYSALTGLAAIASFVVLSYGLWLYRNWRAPTRTVQAVVVRKWTREYDYDLPKERPMILRPILDMFSEPTVTVYQQWVFWVSFRVDDKEIEFAVPEDTYVSLTEGSAGILRFKREKFLAFTPLIGEQS